MGWPLLGDWEGVRIDSLPEIIAALCVAINERRDAIGADLIEWDLPDETTSEWPTAEDFHLLRTNSMSTFEAIKTATEDLLVIEGGIAYTDDSFTTPIGSTANLDFLCYPDGVPEYLLRMQDATIWLWMQKRLNNLKYYRFSFNCDGPLSSDARYFSDPLYNDGSGVVGSPNAETVWADRFTNSASELRSDIILGITAPGFISGPGEIMAFQNDNVSVTYTIPAIGGTLVDSEFYVKWAMGSASVGVCVIASNVGSTNLSVTDTGGISEEDFETFTIYNQLELNATNTINISWEDADDFFAANSFTAWVRADGDSPFIAKVYMDLSSVLTDQS